MRTGLPAGHRAQTVLRPIRSDDTHRRIVLTSIDQYYTSRSTAPSDDKAQKGLRGRRPAIPKGWGCRVEITPSPSTATACGEGRQGVSDLRRRSGVTHQRARACPGPRNEPRRSRLRVKGNRGSIPGMRRRKFFAHGMVCDLPCPCRCPSPRRSRGWRSGTFGLWSRACWPRCCGCERRTPLSRRRLPG